MPIRCRPRSPTPRLSSHRTLSQIQWPSACRMRKLWSMWLIFDEISWSAISNRSMSSEFTSALTSPKVSRSLRPSSPSIVNIDCDQKMRPRDRSQSHNPQRPRLSAVSMRPRTVSLMRSPSRARVDCQWNAKPRIRTTNPVVADSVIDSAASDCQSAVAASWVTIRRPGSDLSGRIVASASPPSASRTREMSVSLPRVADCSVSIAVNRSSVSEVVPAGTRASTRWSASTTTMCRVPLIPHAGIRAGSKFCR